jgi:hypothetical protein
MRERERSFYIGLLGAMAAAMWMFAFSLALSRVEHREWYIRFQHQPAFVSLTIDLLLSYGVAFAIWVFVVLWFRKRRS